MTKYEIELDSNQEQIAKIFVKLDKEKDIQSLLTSIVHGYIEDIAPQTIGDYLDEIKNQKGMMRDFKEAGITNDEVNSAIMAAKNLGINLEK
jgi:DNA-binding phage protein